MRISAATVRRTRCAILWTASLAAVACGDDGSGDDKGDTTPDTGTGTPDTGIGATDAGTVPDASAAEKEALDPTGVKASSARADVVFPLACKNAVACGEMTNTATCISETRAGYDQGVTRGYTDACLDATLDLWSCFATAKCNFDENCGPVFDMQTMLCPKANAGT